jgi:restriction system protein
MPIPEFNEIKVPALKLLSDAALHKLSEIYGTLANHFNLTEQELNEVLPSGVQRRWQNRTNWACYDLFRADLLDRPRKGIYLITELGKTVATQNPKFIDREFLMQFPHFVKFVQSSSGKKEEPGAEATLLQAQDPSAKTKTPEELILAAHQMLHAALKKELLDQVKKMDPFKFEQLVVDLLVAMGYGGSRAEAARVTKTSGDEGRGCKADCSLYK